MTLNQFISDKALSHINLIEDHFYLINSEWTILNLNQVAAEYLGGTQEEIEGGSVWEYFPDDEGMRFPLYMRNAMKNQSTERWEDYRPSHGHWFQSSAFGSEDGLIVICKDITNEKKALDRLKDTENKLSAVFDSMNDGYALLDKSGKLLSFNRVIQEDTKAVRGVKIAEGDDFRECLFFYEVGEFEQHLKDSLQGNVLTFNKKSIFENKIGVWFRIVLHPVYDSSGSLLGVSYSYTCIDDLMLMQEELVRKNKVLEEVAWQQAHQVRGVMTRIMGLFELIKTMNCVSEEKEDYYQMIDLSVHELDSVIQNIIIESSNASSKT